jgi:hypothetical protein
MKYRVTSSDGHEVEIEADSAYFAAIQFCRDRFDEDPCDYTAKADYKLTVNGKRFNTYGEPTVEFHAEEGDKA